MLRFIFLTLVVIIYADGAKISTSFPEALYPSDMSIIQFRQKCPLHSGKIEFCQTNYEDCFGLLRSVTDCEIEFASCVRVVDDPNANNCRKYTDEARLRIRQNGRTFQNEIIEKRMKPAVDKIRKRLKPIYEVYLNMVEVCQIGSRLKLESNRIITQLNSSNPLFNPTMMFFAMRNVESSMNKSEECKNMIEKFETELKKADRETVNGLQIPYQFWFIGTEFGAIGRVITRIIADEVCGNISFEFNHHSAVHLDCYDQQNDQEECDSIYDDKIKYSLKTTDSKKLNCKMFIDLLEAIQLLRGDDFYREASDYFVDTSKTSINRKFNRGFEEFENDSMTKRDTRNSFLQLEVSERSTRRINVLFDDVSSKCGNSKHTLLSCGFNYEYCIHSDNMNCQTRFSACLSDVNANNEQCKDAIQKITNHLYPTTMEVSRRRNDDTYYLLVVLILFAAFVVFSALIIVHYWPTIRILLRDIPKPCETIENNDDPQDGHELFPLTRNHNENTDDRKIIPIATSDGDNCVTVSEIRRESEIAAVTIDENNTNGHPVINNNETASNNHVISEETTQETMKTDNDSVHELLLAPSENQPSTSNQ